MQLLGIMQVQCYCTTLLSFVLPVCIILRYNTKYFHLKMLCIVFMACLQGYEKEFGYIMVYGFNCMKHTFMALYPLKITILS